MWHSLVFTLLTILAARLEIRRGWMMLQQSHDCFLYLPHRPHRHRSSCPNPMPIQSLSSDPDPFSPDRLLHRGWNRCGVQCSSWSSWRSPSWTWEHFDGAVEACAGVWTHFPDPSRMTSSWISEASVGCSSLSHVLRPLM